MKKVEFKRLLELPTRETLFLFKASYYKQVEGGANGPKLENVFLCYHEKEWLCNCPKEFILIKYVLFWDESHVDRFQQHLNEPCKNIKFTVEIEHNDSLPFLDAKVITTATEFFTGTYHKPTFSGVYGNYHSFIPTEYKFGLIVNLPY